MKTKILILALAAFCSFSSISAGNCIDNLFNTASRMPNAEKVNLNSFVLGLLKPFSSELKGIKSMSIIDAENISSKLVCSKEMRVAWCLHHCPIVLCLIIIRSNQRCKDCNKNQNTDYNQSNQRRWVTFESFP